MQGIESLEPAHNPHPAAPPRLSVPALNFHQAWWFPQGDKGRSSALAVGILCEQIRKLVQRCNAGDSAVHIDKIDGRPVTTPVTHFGILGNKVAVGSESSASASANLSDVGHFVMSLRWDDMPVRLSIAVHSEYFTLTLWSMFVCKVHPDDPGPDASREACGNEEKRHALGRLWAEVLKAGGRWLHPDFKPCQRLEIAGAAKKLYDAHNNELFAKIFPPVDWNAALEGYTPFADFRSIILPSALRLNGEVATGEREIARPGPVLDSMADIFNAVNVASNRPLPELMGSLFLDGRVAYVSSLGAHHLEQQGASEGRALPARYLMYAEDVCRWQLGRLVERLNSLGTYRLAAVRDMQSLNQVSDGLRAIGKKLDDVALTDEEKVNATFLAQYDEFNGLSRLKGVAEHFNRDGVSFRIERARFYMKAFDRLVPDLRNRDMQGFQSYPDFVRRRYGGLWDRIDRIGVRHERLAKRLDYLSNHRQTLQLAKSAEALSRSAETQARLLHTAEYVSVIPIAYYGKDAMKPLLASAGWGELKPSAFFVTALAYVIVMLMVTIWRWSEPNADQHAKTELWRWLLIFIIVGLLGGIQLAYSSNSPAEAGGGHAFSAKPVAQSASF